AVLDLPLCGTGEDVAAMHPTIQHHRPTIHGYSGYSAPHYTALRCALADRDHTAIDSMAIAGPLLIVAERDGEWARFLREHRGASALDPEGRWVFFSVPRRAEAPPVCTSGVVALAAASDNRGPVPIAAI